MQLDILRMAEEHQALVDQILNDAEAKNKVQERIGAIVNKWKKA